MRVGLGIGIGMMHGAPWVPDAPTLTAPAEAADVYDGVGVTVSATVTAGQVPNRIDWVLDGTTVVATDSASPYSQTWTPSGVSAGAHTLRARFVYGSGYVDSADTNIVLFDPTVISGLVLWLRADLGVTKDGSDRVSLWADQSGSGNDFSQGVDNNKPVWGTDGGYSGKPTLYFDGTNDGLASTMVRAQPFTLISAGHLVSQAARMILAADPPTVYFGANSATNVALNAGAQISGALDATQRTVYTAIANGGSSLVRANGASVATGAAGANGLTSPAIGYLPGTGFFWYGWLAELLAYTGSLSAGDYGRLESYMGARYGITVS